MSRTRQRLAVFVNHRRHGTRTRVAIRSGYARARIAGPGVLRPWCLVRRQHLGAERW